MPHPHTKARKIMEQKFARLQQSNDRPYQSPLMTLPACLVNHDFVGRMFSLVPVIQNATFFTRERIEKNYALILLLSSTLKYKLLSIQNLS
jgi:hypothetical protein